MAGTYAKYAGPASGGGGGGGIASINGDSTAAQVIAGGTDITVVTSMGTTTISFNAAGSFANTALSNLITTSINQSLLFGSDGVKTIGGSSSNRPLSINASSSITSGTVGSVSNSSITVAGITGERVTIGDDTVPNNPTVTGSELVLTGNNSRISFVSGSQFNSYTSIIGNYQGLFLYVSGSSGQNFNVTTALGYFQGLNAAFNEDFNTGNLGVNPNSRFQFQNGSAARTGGRVYDGYFLDSIRIGEGEPTTGFLSIGNTQGGGGTLTAQQRGNRTEQSSAQTNILTTANASTTLNFTTGSGSVTLTKDVNIGDRVALSSNLSASALVTAINSDSQLTVDTALGDGSSQTMTVVSTMFQIIDQGGLSSFLIDPDGAISIHNTNSAGIIKYLNAASSGHYNWAASAQFNASNAYTITPSTVTDGSSFTTPVLTVNQSGSIALGATSTTPQHILNTSTATNAAGVGTITNLPSGFSGNPTGYIQITINGGTHVIPYW